MRSILDAGFVFWGVFLVFGLVVAAYILWMWWVERDEGPGSGSGPPGPDDHPGGGGNT